MRRDIRPHALLRGCGRDGKQPRPAGETLRAFTAWAAGVDRGGAGGLAAFLRVVDSAVESGAVQSGGTPVLPEGAVSIMTIHRSKGLEFPVVILADSPAVQSARYLQPGAVPPRRWGWA